MGRLKVLKTTRNVVSKVVSEMEDFVCATMGPSGQTIAIHNENEIPVITKDGVSVAKVFEGDDVAENLIATILRQAAEKTNDEAGDGTTTSVAIASAVVREGNKLIASGKDVNAIRKGLESILPKINKELNEMKVAFSDKTEEELIQILYKIAMISTNGDHEISTLIANAVAKAKETGLVATEKGGVNYELKQAVGMKINQAGLVHYNFVLGKPDKKLTLEKCYILFTTHEMENPQIITDITPLLEKIIKANASILIFAKKADKGFLANMLKNNATGSLQNAIVKAPYFGTVGREMMEDLAAYTGGKVFESNFNWKNLDQSFLGYVEKAEVTPFHTYLFNPRSDESRLAQRIELLRAAAQRIQYKTNDADKTMERLGALTGKSFTISIPSTSDIEFKERMDRVEDAINACKGALEAGYLPGGGTALLRISAKMDQNNQYELLMKNILEYPFRKILTNAGESPDVILDKLLTQHTDLVYDAREKVFGQPLEIGVIDSYRVVDRSFSNGFSVGVMLLTTTGILANKPEPYNNNPYDLQY